MIILKIKTPRDWWEEFILWVKEPRRAVCKEYVRYMDIQAQTYLCKMFDNLNGKYKLTPKEINDICHEACICVRKAEIDAENVINDTQRFI